MFAICTAKFWGNLLCSSQELIYLHSCNPINPSRCLLELLLSVMSKSVVDKVLLLKWVVGTRSQLPQVRQKVLHHLEVDSYLSVSQEMNIIT